MALDPVATKFFNEQLRPMADRLAGLLTAPSGFLDAFAAKGIGPLLGIPDALLTQTAPLVPADYGSVSGVALDDGRAAEGIVQLSVRDVLAFYRVIRFLGATLSADPFVTQITMKISVRGGN